MHSWHIDLLNYFVFLKLHIWVQQRCCMKNVWHRFVHPHLLPRHPILWGSAYQAVFWRHVYHVGWLNSSYTNKKWRRPNVWNIYILISTLPINNYVCFFPFLTTLFLAINACIVSKSFWFRRVCKKTFQTWLLKTILENELNLSCVVINIQ